jgi:hypothetical protein
MMGASHSQAECLTLLQLRTRIKLQLCFDP